MKDARRRKDIRRLRAEASEPMVAADACDNTLSPQGVVGRISPGRSATALSRRSTLLWRELRPGPYQETSTVLLLRMGNVPGDTRQQKQSATGLRRQIERKLPGH